MSTFIAFSKSLSKMMSRMPSIRAAEAACRMSRVVPKGRSSADGGVVGVSSDDVGGGRVGVGAGESKLSPSSMKTSQTRSCAGKGIE